LVAQKALKMEVAMKQILKLIPMVLLLAACVPPAKVDPVESVTQQNEIAYYPSSTGLVWQYLLEGEVPGSVVPYELKVEGPQAIDSKVVTAFHFVGRGAERWYYRDFNKDGVFLVAEGTPNFYEVTYTPSVQEYPNQGRIIVGNSWNGISRMKISTPQVKNREATLTYQYRVLAQEKLEINKVSYEAFRISEDKRIALGGTEKDLTESTLIWFVPKIGEIQRSNLSDGKRILVARNFK
jgi:hypothetical protein